MKNLFLSVLFVLTASLSFANTSDINSKSLSKVNSFKSIDNFQNAGVITINSINELAELNKILSNTNDLCDVSFTFEINVGVFSASGTISGGCGEAQAFFDWIMSLFQ
jgi:hypothetical protein